ncbi:hypothetical protein MMC20_000211 [Loxospora ochrophaea]|nr:hypothetical protein [Loxospora ochrophaea]
MPLAFMSFPPGKNDRNAGDHLLTAIEVRMMIYECLLVTTCTQPNISEDVMGYQPEHDFYYAPQAQILRVSKQVYTEAFWLLYRRNTFTTTKTLCRGEAKTLYSARRRVLETPKEIDEIPGLWDLFKQTNNTVAQMHEKIDNWKNGDMDTAVDPWAGRMEYASADICSLLSPNTRIPIYDFSRLSRDWPVSRCLDLAVFICTIGLEKARTITRLQLTFGGPGDARGFMPWYSELIRQAMPRLRLLILDWAAFISRTKTYHVTNDTPEAKRKDWNDSVTVFLKYLWDLVHALPDLKELKIRNCVREMKIMRDTLMDEKRNGTPRSDPVALWETLTGGANAEFWHTGTGRYTYKHSLRRIASEAKRQGNATPKQLEMLKQDVEDEPDF